MEREDFGTPARTALKFGGQKLNLRPHDASTEQWIAAAVCTPGTQDLCFIVAVTSADVVAHLQGCGVTVELGPVARQGALGPMQSVYCRDPEGNLIEIASYSG
jgi:catechol 2,3-dioxygenase-like lactoylglutathione lyase family enzyme